MRVVVGHDVAVATWVGERVGAVMTPPYTAIGFLDRTGAIVAGFVFYNFFIGGNVDMMAAASGRLTRGSLRAIANYAFEQAGASRVTVRPPSTHTRAIEQLKRAGFKPEAVCKAYYGPAAALQLRLLKSEAKRWL